MKQLWLALAFVFGIIFPGSGQTTSQTNQGTPESATGAAVLLGKWQGSYGGAAAGKCALEFTQDAGGKTTGQIAIQPDGGGQSPMMPFDSVELEGTSLKAVFTDPDGDKSQLEGKLENNQLKGNWKTASNEGGTWQTDKMK